MSSENAEQPGMSGWGYFWNGVKVVGGGFEVAGGYALFAAGAAASATGVGALVGVPSMVGGGAIGAHGVDQVQSGLRSLWYGEEIPSVAYQIGDAIAGPWGGFLADLGPGIGGLAKGAAAGAKTLGQFLGKIRQAGGLKAYLQAMRQQGRLAELLKTGTPEELTELYRKGEVTAEELRAAGYNVDELGLKVTKAPQVDSGGAGASAADDVASPGNSADAPASSGDSVGGSGGGSPKTGSYSGLAKELEGTGQQAHHLNQNAAFKDIIPESEGLAVAMRGNAFTDVGSPHYEAHRSLEGFWNQFRRDGARYGQTPTNAEYGAALETSLRAGGLSADDAARVANQAAEQRAVYGLGPNDPVPHVPGRLNQKSPPK